MNGTPLSAKDGSPLAASSLKSLNVMGGPLNDVIDLSGVTLAAFTSLTQVNVDGGAGDDLIIGSEFADNLTSQSGNDTVSSSLGADTLNAIVVTYTAAELPTTTTLDGSSTSATSGRDSGQATGNGASTTFGISLRSIVYIVCEFDHDSPEDHMLAHFHWQRESLPSHLPSGTSNEFSNSFDARVVLASLSSLELKAQALSRLETKLRNLSENSDTAKSEPSDGLIDIDDDQTSKGAKQPAGEIKTVESPASSDEIPLIAARVAMPNGRTQPRS
ncbi:MAG TPA: hypothetical protein VK137_09210, partial [Planctomycetaceae bacterium]|nr:hypothetical protein [Planctomycetaceae bacterium]